MFFNLKNLTLSQFLSFHPWCLPLSQATSITAVFLDQESKSIFISNNIL